MSTQQTPGPAPSEEELRAAYEAELARITATEMIAQAAVSLLNLGAYRMGPPPAAPGAEAPEDAASGRDLEQVRDAIDGARALLGILERRIPAELGGLREALSRLQMAYAAEVGRSAGEGAAQPAASPSQAPPRQPSEGAAGGSSQAPEPGQEGGQRGPGPAESSGRLWVPGR